MARLDTRLKTPVASSLQHGTIRIRLPTNLSKRPGPCWAPSSRRAPASACGGLGADVIAHSDPPHCVRRSVVAAIAQKCRRWSGRRWSPQHCGIHRRHSISLLAGGRAGRRCRHASFCAGQRKDAVVRRRIKDRPGICRFGRRTASTVHPAAPWTSTTAMGRGMHSAPI